MAELFGKIINFTKSFIIDVQLGSKYVSNKDNKYAVNFKLTQTCIAIKTFYNQKEESTLILSNLSLFLLF